MKRNKLTMTILSGKRHNVTMLQPGVQLPYPHTTHTHVYMSVYTHTYQAWSSLNCMTAEKCASKVSQKNASREGETQQGFFFFWSDKMYLPTK